MKWFSIALSAAIAAHLIGVAWAVTRAPQSATQSNQEKSAAELVKDGMAFYRVKQYPMAAKLLQEAIAKGANQHDVLYNAACALALAGDKEKALEFLAHTIEAGFRNREVLNSDPDLIALHADARWPKIVSACEAQQAKYLKEHSDPNNARFVTSDIANFWKAYDKAMAATPGGQAAIFQREYIDPGTVGLRDWVSRGRLKANVLLKTIDSHKEFYKAIRSLTTDIERQYAPTIAALRRFKELYTEAIFPDVYFVIGQLQSGGTSSGNGLLMGAEMFTRATETPTSELSGWEKGAIMQQSEIPALVAHEFVHFQQRYSGLGSALCSCLQEGSADFLGKLTSGRLITRMEETHFWANARERELWQEFQKDMDGKGVSRWLYGSSGENGRPVDLGYWIGFKISEAYYNNAADKKQAVRDILIMPDCTRFLLDSRYAEKFAANTPARK